jgi:hypothetical protein
MEGYTSPSRCLATTKWIHIQDTDWWEGFKKYAVEMGSGAMIYIPSFIKTSSGIQNLIVHRHKGNNRALKNVKIGHYSLMLPLSLCRSVSSTRSVPWIHSIELQDDKLARIWKWLNLSGGTEVKSRKPVKMAGVTAEPTSSRTRI